MYVCFPGTNQNYKHDPNVLIIYHGYYNACLCPVFASLVSFLRSIVLLYNNNIFY